MSDQDQFCPQCNSRGQLLCGGVQDYFFRSEGQWDYYQCTSRRCGVAWPSPHPDDATLTLAYANYYTKEAKQVNNFAGRARAWLTKLLYWDRLTLLLQALRSAPIVGRIIEDCFWASGGVNPDPNGVVVDIGCGSGDRLALLVTIGWGSAIGVESDAKAVAVGAALGRNVRLGSAEDLPVESESADVALMHHVIEHVRQPRKAFEEAFRVLRSGSGRLIVITPNIDSAMRLRWGRYWRGFEAPRHLTIYSVEALRAALHAVGFEIQLASTTARSASWISTVSKLAYESAAVESRSIGRALLSAERDFRVQQRLIRMGAHIGDEIVVVAWKIKERCVGSGYQ